MNVFVLTKTFSDSERGDNTHVLGVFTTQGLARKSANNERAGLEWSCEDHGVIEATVDFSRSSWTTYAVERHFVLGPSITLWSAGNELTGRTS